MHAVSAKSKAAFALTPVPVRVLVWVIHTSEAHTNGVFIDTPSYTNTCNSITIKNLMKIVKYLEFRAIVYSIITSSVVRVYNLSQNCVMSLLCAV